MPPPGAGRDVLSVTPSARALCSRAACSGEGSKAEAFSCAREANGVTARTAPSATAQVRLPQPERVLCMMVSPTMFFLMIW